jgi:AraC-like DNA-binding protein
VSVLTQPAAGHRLAARMIAPIVAAAKACGLDVGQLLAEAGLGEQLARKRGLDVHVTLAQYGALWQVAVVRSGLGDLPLRAAVGQGIDGFGVVGFALMTSPTIGAAFARLARYYGLLSTAGRWSRADESPDHVALRFDLEPGEPLATRCAVEFALAETVHFSTVLAGRRVPLYQTRFPHARPADEVPYRRLFGPGLHWKAGEAALVIPRSALELPLVKADPHLAAYFEAQAEALVRQGQAETVLPLAAQVRRRIIEALPSGPPSLPAVARALGQSPRSLRRHLADEGTSFQQLVEQIRSELAVQHLEDPRLTASEIAFLVGFSELSPFLRAFRRWTGLTPGEYRQRAKGPARPGRRAALHSRPAKAR